MIPKKVMLGVAVTVCILFISVVFTVYAEYLPDESNPYDYEAVVKGTVYNTDTKAPIDNALVTIEYHEVLRKDYTDSNGQYIFKHVPECFCLKNMSASKASYMTQQIWVAVADVTIVDFYLNPLQNGSEPTEGSVTGWVTDADTNEPIDEAEMTLTYHESIRVENTDSEGQYTFDGVPICFCLKNVSASKSGYESQYQLVAVHEITYVNFSLRALEEPTSEPEEPDNPDAPENPEDTDDPEEHEEPQENKGIWGTLTGVVTDAITNIPIHNAFMTLKYHDIVRTQFTDSEGQYTFDGVPICFCLKNISASKSGYESQDQSVPVSEITYANFSLNPSENSPGDLPNPGPIQHRTNDKEITNESMDYYFAIIGLITILVVLIIFGISIYKNKKKSHIR